MTDIQHPIPADRWHSVDYRDEVEHVEVARFRSELPAEHPARIAYVAGAWEAADAVSLSWLVAAEPELLAALVEANFTAYRRMLARQGAYFRP